MESVSRELGIIISLSALAFSWMTLPDGNQRNIAILISSAIFVFLLLGSRFVPQWTRHMFQGQSQGQEQAGTPQEYQQGFQEVPQEGPVNPKRSLDECIRFHRITNHPAAQSLQARIDDYRRIVILVANERNGQGTLWKKPDSDVRTTACLCGSLTRDELMKSLELEEVQAEAPRVGAGMGIESVLANISPTRGKIIAEDGKPAHRVLRDPVVDHLIQVLSAHRPEAREDLLLARERYIENVLRRLVGPLDDKGNPVVPLCRWQKRFDGEHFRQFEELEGLFQGQ